MLNLTFVYKLLLVMVSIVAGLASTALGLATSHTNLLGWFLVFVGLGYFMGGGIYLALVGPRNAVRVERGDRSIWLLAPGFLVVFFGAPLEYLFLPAILPHTTAMQAIGIATIVAAMLLRMWVRSALGGMYTGHVQVKADHRVVREGPYRYIRHPGYTGFILMAIGFALGFSSLIGLAAIPVLVLPGLAYRMNVEEKLLTEDFGDEYRDYTRRTKQLVPGIW